MSKTVAGYMLAGFLVSSLNADGCEIDLERRTIIGVGLEYGLTNQEISLLLAIRRAENGPDGCEFGVGAGNPDHPARQFAPKPGQVTGGGINLDSMVEQACWAAGTIRKRFDGDVFAFAQRWCPVGWEDWGKNVRWHMQQPWCSVGQRITLSY